MKKIYINEDKLSLLNSIKEDNEEKEVTYYEFFLNVISFLKQLLNNPQKADINSFFNNLNISKDDLLTKMADIGLIKSDEKIIEVPVAEGKTHPFGKKLVSKHIVKYKIPKNRFEEKIHELYKEFFNKKESVNEDGEGGGGATSCGSVMQGGGTNPSAGQYEAPFGQLQRRGFYKTSLSRNKDEDNGSISMNRQK